MQTQARTPIPIISTGLVTPRAAEINAFLREHLSSPIVQFHKPPERYTHDLPRAWALATQAAETAWSTGRGAELLAAGARVAVIIGSSRSAHWPESFPIPGREPDLLRLVNTTQTALAGHIARYLRCNGPRLVISSACTSATAAICVACDMLAAGSCDAALVGAVDCGTAPDVRQLFQHAGLPLAHTPLECRPFDRKTQGISLDDAAGFFLLTRTEFAAPGKAATKPLAHIVAHAQASDPRDRCGIGATHEALATCLRKVLTDADCLPRDILHLHAHGTGNPAGDVAELAALDQFACDNFPEPLRIFASKHLTGHCLGATPALELGITLACLNAGISPPIPGLIEVRPTSQLNFHGAARASAQFSILANFGLWGTAAALAIQK